MGKNQHVIRRDDHQWAVHDVNGQICQKLPYGNDPCPPRG